MRNWSKVQTQVVAFLTRTDMPNYATLDEVGRDYLAVRLKSPRHAEAARRIAEQFEADLGWAIHIKDAAKADDTRAWLEGYRAELRQALADGAWRKGTPWYTDRERELAYT